MYIYVYNICIYICIYVYLHNIQLLFARASPVPAHLLPSRMSSPRTSSASLHRVVDHVGYPSGIIRRHWNRTEKISTAQKCNQTINDVMDHVPCVVCHVLY